MNTSFTSKFVQHLSAKKKANKGFTLIELLVVVIIIGVLAAIALPNLLNQVAKGRQSEAKNNLGSVNRTQQAYRLEKGTFGTIGDGQTGSLPVKIQAEYYTYSDGTNNATAGAQNAASIGTYTNDIKDYASSVGQTAQGSFSSILCEGTTPDQAGAVTSTNGTACANSTEVN